MKKVLGSIALVTLAVSVVPTSAFAGLNVYDVKGSSVNIRTSASTSATVVKSVSAGTDLVLYADSTSSYATANGYYWIKVMYPSSTKTYSTSNYGWIARASTDSSTVLVDYAYSAKATSSLYSYYDTALTRSTGKSYSAGTLLYSYDTYNLMADDGEPNAWRINNDRGTYASAFYVSAAKVNAE